MSTASILIFMQNVFSGYLKQMTTQLSFRLVLWCEFIMCLVSRQKNQIYMNKMATHYVGKLWQKDLNEYLWKRKFPLVILYRNYGLIIINHIQHLIVCCLMVMWVHVQNALTLIPVKIFGPLKPPICRNTIQKIATFA